MKFQFNQKVRIKLSAAEGSVKGRADYGNERPNSYWVKYLGADGIARSDWFDEEDLEATE